MPCAPRIAAICLVLIPATASSDESCVLLRNGNVMTGQVAQQGDRLLLSRDGSGVWLDEASVATVTGSLDEAYAWQRNRLGSPTVDDHLRLASWCLKQGLLAQASRELLDARSLAPGDSRVVAVERQLVQDAFPVAQASHQAKSPRRRERILSKQQIAQLPPGTLEEFTRHVQPLLVNNCTASGCHQQGGQQEFQLDRALLHGMADRRSTSRNLSAVLRVVDQESPDASPLLAAANRPHAGRSTAAFTGRRAPLGRKLERWVRAVSATPVASAQSTRQARETAGVFSLVKEEKLRQEFTRRVESKAAPSGLRDEFDPAIFNRGGGRTAD